MREQDFLRLMQKIDRKYFEEANSRAAQSAQDSRWEDFMKKVAFPILTGVICTVLVCGIAAAGYLLLRRDVDVIQNPHGTGYAAVEAEGVKIHAALTGEPFQNSQRLPEMEFWGNHSVAKNYQQFAVADSGWYTVGNPTPEDEARGICYTDAASGQTIYLCAKPECLHDGSDYCLATNADYSILRIVWYEDMLYAVAHKHTHNEEKPDAIVLLAYQPDGTGMRELATLDDRGESQNIELIAHRGALWVAGTVEEHIFNGDEALGIDDSFEVHLYDGIWHYEIAKSRLTVLASDVSHHYHGLTNLQADGDSVYVIKQSNEAIGIPRGLYRISAQTGEITLIMDNLETMMRDFYMVSDDRLFWITKAEKASPDTKDIYILHTRSDDTETRTGVPRGDLYFTDGQNLFIVMNQTKLVICDLNGNVLKTQTFPRVQRESDSLPDTNSFACADGVLYHVRTEYYGSWIGDIISHYESISLADYLNGDGDFTPLFDAHDVVWRPSAEWLDNLETLKDE